MKVCLDAGHGGKDPGAVCKPLVESKLNLQLQLYLYSALAHKGHGVLFTRANDKGLLNKYRVSMANASKSDLFVAIHHNAWHKPTANGFEVLHYPDSAKGKFLAELISSQVSANCNIRNRGPKPRKGLMVLRATSMPAILIEAGFVTGDVDRENVLLEDKDRSVFYEAIGEALVDAIDVVFG